jgi:hypothetical protein
MMLVLFMRILDYVLVINVNYWEHHSRCKMAVPSLFKIRDPKLFDSGKSMLYECLKTIIHLPLCNFGDQSLN